MDKKKIAALLVATALGAVIYIKFSTAKNFMYAGTVEATQVDISSRISGVIESVPAREGDKVQQGQLLVKLAVEDIEVAAQAAERDYKRAVELLSAGSMNQESFDRVRFRRDDALVRLGWSVVKSPLEATVITRYHEPGELVPPGTKLLTLADLKNAWAYIYVPQPLIAGLRPGMQVEGFAEGGQTRKLSGRIERINDTAEFTPRNVQTREERTRLVFGVKVAFDNTDEYLKPGMTVEIKLPE